MKISIIDYSIGNVQSIINAFYEDDIETFLTCDEKLILEADAVILPGVGAFNKAMSELRNRNLPNMIYKFIQSGKPLLGICLGMQLLLEESEEFVKTEGLGLCEGKVKKFPVNPDVRFPHVSWNELSIKHDKSKSALLNGIKEINSFYFVHNFVCMPKNQSEVLATTSYGNYEFCSVIKKDNIYGCQFHPEKSGLFGNKVLKNFIEIAKK